MMATAIAPAEPETRPFDSYVRNCFLDSRGESLFTLTEDGWLATLDGYAIIPIEHYVKLTGEALPETSDQESGS